MRDALVLMLLVTAVPSAQSPATPPKGELRFEVASVKPVKERRPSGGFPSVFVATNTVQWFIGFAYKTPLPQIEGGDSWTRNDLFEVRATLPDSVRDKSLGTVDQQDQVAEMTKHLLRERFALRLRFEEGTRSKLFLRIKNPNRAAAPGRLPPDPDCVQRAEALRTKIQADAKGKPTPLIAPGGLIQPPCGLGRRYTGGDSFYMTSKGTTIAQFAMQLTALLGEPVEDQTGIQGYFGLDLEVGADQDPVLRRSASPPSTGGRSIQTAIGDDLNLALVGGKVPVQKIVIERVERPTPD
jgi:uncharacterized protein (TIGR03435 family)